MDKFVDLIDYLKREKRDDFYLDLSKVEEIVGQPLSKSAYQYSAYWSTSGTHYLANEIYNCGFVVKPDLKNKRIRLVRVGTPLPSKEKTKKAKKKTTKKAAKREDIPNPNKKLIKQYLAKWEKLEDYTAQEKAVNRVFDDYRSNKELENVLIKCSVLNDFYSTNIFKIYAVAKHILKLNIDARLSKKDPTLVNDIAQNNIAGKDKNFYSFASKYCSHHNQDDYPIYDYYVEKVLLYFRNVDGFAEFKNEELKNYTKFKNILVQFKEFYKLDGYSLKDLDKFLWQFGKRYFPKKY